MPDALDSTPPPAPPEGVSVKKIAIIGTAPSSRPAAPYPTPGCPYNPKEYEIWCIGIDPQKITQGWHRWYELHDPLWLIDKQNPDYSPENEIHIRWLREVSDKGANVRLIRPSPLIPNASLVNRPEIEKEWPGPFAREFRNSTIAWMMAEAIIEGANEIGLWGVDMALTSEYQSQRSGVFFFLHEAAKRGIKVLIPSESDLFHGTAEYPECGESPTARKSHARRREIMAQLGQAQMLKMQGTIREATAAGALETHDWWYRTFVSKG